MRQLPTHSLWVARMPVVVEVLAMNDSVDGRAMQLKHGEGCQSWAIMEEDGTVSHSHYSAQERLKNPPTAVIHKGGRPDMVLVSEFPIRLCPPHNKLLGHVPLCDGGQWPSREISNNEPVILSGSASCAAQGSPLTTNSHTCS